MPISATLPALTAAPPASIPIACLGRRASAVFWAESQWRVRAVFRRSFYCQSDGGAFVCFGPLTLGNGPLNVLYRMPQPMDWEAAGLGIDSSAVCDGTTVRVAKRFTFSLSGARLWCPAAPSAPWQPAAMKASLAELASEVRVWPARGGLQALVPMLVEDAPAAAGVAAASPLTLLAMKGITPLGAWLESRVATPLARTPVPVSALDALLGLGPGLTPSGDDFLGGVLVALHHFGAVGAAASLAAEVVARSRQRTNEISCAHLTAAAGGEGLAPLHDILARLSAAGAFRGGACLTAIDAIGHTSGWDALAGVTFAAAVVARVCAVGERSGPPCESGRPRVARVP